MLTLEPQDITFSKPVTIIIPTPVYSAGGDNVDILPSLRLLSCEPRDNRKSMSHAPTYQWHDITDTTPLSVVNECASFTTSHPARQVTLPNFYLVLHRSSDVVTCEVDCKIVVFLRMGATWAVFERNFWSESRNGEEGWGETLKNALHALYVRGSRASRASITLKAPV